MTFPDWWGWELELTPHVEKRMEDRTFTEVDLRLMLERAIITDLGDTELLSTGGSREKATFALLLQHVTELHGCTSADSVATASGLLARCSLALDHIDVVWNEETEFGLAKASPVSSNINTVEPDRQGPSDGAASCLPDTQW